MNRKCIKKNDISIKKETELILKSSLFLNVFTPSYF